MAGISKLRISSETHLDGLLSLVWSVHFQVHLRAERMPAKRPQLSVLILLFVVVIPPPPRQSPCQCRHIRLARSSACAVSMCKLQPGLCAVNCKRNRETKSGSVCDIVKQDREINAGLCATKAGQDKKRDRKSKRVCVQHKRDRARSGKGQFKAGLCAN